MSDTSFRASLARVENRLTPDRVFWGLVLIGAIQMLVTVVAPLLPSAEPLFGGDFLAFWSASRETLAGDMAGLYAKDGLADAIFRHVPTAPEEAERLTWQYPPQATLVFSPVGLLPYQVALVVWGLLGLAAYWLALGAADISGRLRVAVFFSFFILIALKTGQNGFFTASLLLLAVMLTDRRPVLAGLAAALLTIKPQLGFLLPLAFLAGRAYMPFLVAAVGSLALWGMSLLVAGQDAWLAFFAKLGHVGSAVESGTLPLYKMVTAFSALRLAGVPTGIAISICAVLAICVTSAVMLVWRRTSDPELRLAAISVGTLIIAPYAYYYELTLVLPAVFLLARRAYRTGWLEGERATLFLVFAVSLMLPGSETRSGIGVPFIWMVLCAAFVARRLFHELGPHFFINRDASRPTPAAGGLAT